MSKRKTLLSNSASHLFYGLLRIALWADREHIVRNEIASLEKQSYSQNDWESICKFALEQTVMGLLDKAIDKVPESLWPPKNVRMQMFMHGNRIKQMHAVLNRSLYGITQKLNGESVYSVLLKGQGIAQDYAQPEARQCGDLDIWVGNDVYQDICDAIQKEGYSADYAMARADKHLNFTYEKSTVEIHRYSANLNYAHKNTAFHSWTDECLKSTQRCMWISNDWKACGHESEGAVKVLLPEATYNALYIFLHLYRHFIYGGVGFRQLCDWCRCIYVHYSEIDLVELEARLKDFKLYHPWQVFGAMCVEVLGMPKEKMPFYTDEYNSKIGRLQSYVESDGNFGHISMKNKVRPQSLLAGKFFSLRCKIERFASLLFLFPKDVIATFFICIPHGLKAAWYQYRDRH